MTAALLAFQVVLAAAHADVTPVVSKLTGQYARLASWSTTYEVEVFAATGGANSGPDRLLRRARYVWSNNESQFRIDRQVVAGDVAVTNGDARMTFVWDGTTWKTWRPGERTITLSTGISPNVETDCAALFSDLNAPFFAFREPLDRFLTTREINQETLDGRSILTCVLPNGRSFVQFETDPTDPSRFQAIALEGRDGDTGERRYRIEYRVLEWGLFDGIPLPAVAERRSWSFRGSAADGASHQRIVFRRLATQSGGFHLDDVSAAERIAGTSIIDTRASFVYAIGEDTISVDGHRATVPAVIDAPLSNDALLAMQLQFHPASFSAETAIPVAESSPWIGRILTAFVLLAMFGTLVLVSRTSRKSTNRLSMVTLVALLVSGVGALALHKWMYAKNELGPPSDPFSHDFGEVPFEGTGMEREHVFRIVNRRETTRSIRDVKSTCGCTLASLSDRELSNGEGTDLRVSLRFSEPGTKTASIWVIYTDGATEEFKVRGTATSATKTWCFNPRLHVKPGEKHHIIFGATSSTVSASPPEPALPLPPMVRGQFLGWNLIDVGDPGSSRLRRWHGAWLVEADDNVGPNPPRLRAQYGDGHTEEIDISGWPWR